jgi:hypothetical protein
MLTITKSPKQELREHFDALGYRVGGGLRVDTWIGLDCGDVVCRTDDPRHEGRVRAILHGAWVRVVWENGWKTLRWTTSS